MRNTAIYCALAVLCALIVNPLAAYALSRYRPRSTYAIPPVPDADDGLPGEFTQIPAFLMLRDLGLLNSFAALILPRPRERATPFSCSRASSTPCRASCTKAPNSTGRGVDDLLDADDEPFAPDPAVVALHAFTAAYSNFMFALLICPTSGCGR
jgi:multiple sugar transport system permease protein